jgi:glycosyltransferase involved in cell wall biosynthesis
MHVLYSFPDGVGRPGIGTTAFHQVEGLARQGVDVSLFCTSIHRELPLNVRVVRTLSVGPRRIPHRVLGIERSYRYHDSLVARALARDARDYDVVHCWPRATVRTCEQAHRWGVPCFREVPNTHTAHAFEVVARELEALGLPPPQGHSHTFDQARLAREEQEYAIADALLVPSAYSRETFRERGFQEGKLLLHRYGYEPERFSPRVEAQGEAERPFTALFVGSCEPRKGLHHALRAWRDSGAAERGRFIICGSFSPEYRAVLGELLDHRSIELRGFVADPSELMRASDVFVLPSVEEGSALVTYEAQACGCVLAVSRAAGARCRDGIEGLVHEPGDVATLTDHLRRLDTDPELLQRLRAASIAQSKDLTWSAAATELAEIYSGSLATASPTGDSLRPAKTSIPE